MPVLLSETPDAPAFLYVKGDLSACRRNVAVVGTREPTSHGRATAERITEYLVSEGWSVVS